MSSGGRAQDLSDSGSGATATNNNRRAKQRKERALPTAGYLYQEKTDVVDLIDPCDMGLKVLQARRKGSMKKYFSPDRYRQQVESLLAKVTEKKVDRPEADLDMWGDCIAQSDTWPKVKKNGHLRLLYYNVNGISARQDYFEMDMLMQTIAQVQADITLISEVNLNMHKGRVRARLKQSVRDFYKYAKVELAYPPELPFTTTDFNMGGLMAIVQGGLAGRISDQGVDPIGRWCWITIAGDEEEMTFIGAYKVGKHAGTYGGLSVSQQEIRALLKRDHPHANKPRLAFDLDLSNFCIEQQNLGREIALFMDANTPLDSAETRIFLSDSNLYSVANYKFQAWTHLKHFNPDLKP